MPAHRDRLGDQIIDVLEKRGGSTRRELALALDLPSSSIASAVDRLMARGVVHEETDVRSDHGGRVGRPPNLVKLSRASQVAVLVIGHHSIEAAVVTPDGTVVAHDARAYDSMWADDALEPGIALLRDTLAALDPGHPSVSGLVIAVPRPNHDGTARAMFSESSFIGWPLGMPRWWAVDPEPRLREEFGVEVFVENDANLAAIGEQTFGAGRGAKDVIHLTFVPALGAGVVSNGSLVRGARGIAGEIGHIQVDERGPLCRCGNRGCMLMQPDARFLIDAIRRATAARAGLRPDSQELLDAGDQHLRRMFREEGSVLAPHLSTACMFLNPSMIILDAALGSAADAVIEGLSEGIRRSSPANVFTDLEIRRGELPGRAVILGAAALFAHERSPAARAG
jgi:predicted NBD/HSP70 family sugar kinase